MSDTATQVLFELSDQIDKLEKENKRLEKKLQAIPNRITEIRVSQQVTKDMLFHVSGDDEMRRLHERAMHGMVDQLAKYVEIEKFEWPDRPGTIQYDYRINIIE